MLDLDSRRIAKNTLVLYVRMLVTMIISLYVARIVLEVLGVEDFGIYNIIAGVIVLFSFLEASLSTATQRYINFYMGKDDIAMVKRVFSLSLTIHALLAIIVVLLAETIGIWFLNTQLNIPESRVDAANWVFQLTLLSTCLRIIRIPYQANIIANERMSFYAYMGILEVILKLLLVIILSKLAYDKLILYASIISLLSLIMLVSFVVYNLIYYSLTRYTYYWDKSLFKEILGFSGWSLFGQVASLSSIQGANILLNMFFSVTLNAAMGIASTVSAAAYAFISNYQIAFRPQIVKSYAANDREYFINLILSSSKYSYFLFLILSVPIYFNIEYILDLWLVNVPEYAGIFCQLIILYLLIDSIQAPLWIAIQARGDIRNYQLIMSSMVLFNLPISYYLLFSGYSAEVVLYVRVLINILTYCARILYLKIAMKLPVKKYMDEVFVKVLYVTSISFSLPYFINGLNIYHKNSLFHIVISLIIASFIVLLFGLKKNERIELKVFVRILFQKYIKT
jgi:O-antigen/teichoic acid export membrane protein